VNQPRDPPVEPRVAAEQPEILAGRAKVFAVLAQHGLHRERAAVVGQVSDDIDFRTDVFDAPVVPRQQLTERLAYELGACRAAFDRRRARHHRDDVVREERQDAVGIARVFGGLEGVPEVRNLVRHGHQ
jgi:hypothetical protein